MGRISKGKAGLIFYLIFLHASIGLLIYERFFLTRQDTREVAVSEVVPLPSPLAIDPNFDDANRIEFKANTANENVQPSATPTPSPQTQTQSAPPQFTGTVQKLMIPVVGIKKDKLADTFSDARSENRVHNAIDIMAAQGTPVVAAADGQIARFFNSDLGGITIYQFSKDKKVVYYYAHLQRIAENLTEKAEVKQGNVIGYVGDTGNAGAGNYHLHFSIIIPADEKRYWEGENINPFPLLQNGIEAQIR